MTRFVILTICAACLFLPARMLAQEPASEIKKLQATMDQINQKLEKLDKIDKIEKGQSDILQRITDMQNTLITLQSRVFALEQAAGNKEKDLRDLKRQIESLQSDMDSLRSQMGSTSFKPSPNASTSMFSGMSTLRLVNDYPTEVMVNVNGVTYQVMPGEMRSIPIPAGTFTYRIIGSPQTPVDQVRNVAIGKMFQVRIHQ
jgi:hypothetical protein